MGIKLDMGDKVRLPNSEDVGEIVGCGDGGRWIVQFGGRVELHYGAELVLVKFAPGTDPGQRLDLIA